MLELQRRPRVSFPALLACFMALVSTAKTSPANRPWDGKPYTEWTQQEVERVLTKSPWAKRVKISMLDQAPASVMDTSADQGAGAARAHDPTDPTTGLPIDRAPRPPERPVAAPPYPNGTGRDFFSVTWTSSLTYRQAQARQMVLLNRITAKKAEEILALPPKYFVIFMDSSTLRNGFDTAAAKKSAYLALEPSQQKIVPVGVFAIHGGGLKFFFPREVDGKPVIEERDKRVHFHCKLGMFTINETFDLKDMTHDGQRDI